MLSHAAPSPSEGPVSPTQLAHAASLGDAAMTRGAMTADEASFVGIRINRGPGMGVACLKWPQAVALFPEHMADPMVGAVVAAGGRPPNAVVRLLVAGPPQGGTYAEPQQLEGKLGTVKGVWTMWFGRAALTAMGVDWNNDREDWLHARLWHAGPLCLSVNWRVPAEVQAQLAAALPPPAAIPMPVPAARQPAASPAPRPAPAAAANGGGGGAGAGAAAAAGSGAATPAGAKPWETEPLSAEAASHVPVRLAKQGAGTAFLLPGQALALFPEHVENVEQRGAEANVKVVLIVEPLAPEPPAAATPGGEGEASPPPPPPPPPPAPPLLLEAKLGRIKQGTWTLWFKKAPLAALGIDWDGEIPDTVEMRMWHAGPLRIKVAIPPQSGIGPVGRVSVPTTAAAAALWHAGGGALGTAGLQLQALLQGLTAAFKRQSPAPDTCAVLLSAPELTNGFLALDRSSMPAVGGLSSLIHGPGPFPMTLSLSLLKEEQQPTADAAAAAAAAPATPDAGAAGAGPAADAGVAAGGAAAEAGAPASTSGGGEGAAAQGAAAPAGGEGTASPDAAGAGPSSGATSGDETWEVALEDTGDGCFQLSDVSALYARLGAAEGDVLLFHSASPASPTAFRVSLQRASSLDEAVLAAGTRLPSEAQGTDAASVAAGLRDALLKASASAPNGPVVGARADVGSAPTVSAAAAAAAAAYALAPSDGTRAVIKVNSAGRYYGLPGALVHGALNHYLAGRDAAPLVLELRSEEQPESAARVIPLTVARHQHGTSRQYSISGLVVALRSVNAVPGDILELEVTSGSEGRLRGVLRRLTGPFFNGGGDASQDPNNPSASQTPASPGLPEDPWAAGADGDAGGAELAAPGSVKRQSLAGGGAVGPESALRADVRVRWGSMPFPRPLIDGPMKGYLQGKTGAVPLLLDLRHEDEPESALETVQFNVTRSIWSNRAGAPVEKYDISRLVPPLQKHGADVNDILELEVVGESRLRGTIRRNTAGHRVAASPSAADAEAGRPVALQQRAAVGIPRIKLEPLAGDRPQPLLLPSVRQAPRPGPTRLSDLEEDTFSAALELAEAAAAMPDAASLLRSIARLIDDHANRVGSRVRGEAEPSGGAAAGKAEPAAQRGQQLQASTATALTPEQQRLPASSLSAAHLQGCALSRDAVPPPALQPGELRLCGLTFHPELAPGVRSAMEAWEAGLAAQLAADGLTGGLADAAPEQLQIRVLESPATSAAGIQDYSIAADVALLLGLTTAFNAPLPEHAPQLGPRSLAPGPDEGCGGAGLFAAAALPKGAVLGVLGGYVMPKAAAKRLSYHGYRFLPDDAKAELATRAGPSAGEAGVRYAWQLLEGAFRFPMTGSPDTCDLSMLGYGSLAALINDPRREPRGWVEGNDVGDEGGAAARAANCGVVPVSVRGLTLPVLVALRDIQPGEQLLRDYGADWWTAFKGAWGMAEHRGLSAGSLLHPRAAASGLAGSDDGSGREEAMPQAEGVPAGEVPGQAEPETSLAQPLGKRPRSRSASPPPGQRQRLDGADDGGTQGAGQEAAVVPQ
ncbi:hypothetical protein HYH03_006430 [Edaphochlamys debaryana]|uniref:SET domain-containing protein n=1 Tax=Edaphochlamys debaryana TaxID=47281 RepID=A0A835YAS8_9CHLO|nr:hypothetical protein HYH03_006430 [Edaphochlamys debaryana]|eukprot:KAG2495485.1 hypothetical protein HYH03_006430 [Edaphochlamys debaryana]